MALSHNSHMAAGISGHGNGISAKYWQMMCRLRLSLKSKMFIWRTSKVILPTMTELFRRKVVSSPYWPRCKPVLETLAHAIFECREMDKTWSLPPFLLPRVATHISFWACFIQTRQRLDEHSLLLALVVAWKIWEGRNSEIHASPHSPLMDVVQWSHDYLRLYHEPQVKPVSGPTPSITSSWRPPPPSVLKINVDVAFTSQTNFFRVGLAARDHTGACCWWASDPKKFWALWIR